MVDNHIDRPYHKSISHIHIDIPIDISLTSEIPYRSPISVSHIDIGSYLVTRPPTYCLPRHTMLCDTRKGGSTYVE